MSSSKGENAVPFLAGALSGIVEGIVVQPFDMVKTRHQLNTGNNLGVFATLAKLYKEGGVRLWYRGMGAELIGLVPKASAMYGTYGSVHKYLSAEKKMGDTSLVAAIAGLCSGIPEALTVTPAQIVKVRLQAKEHKGKYSGPTDCVRKLLAEEGISAFAIGLTPTLCRNCIWNTVYFGIMHSVKGLLPKTKSKLESSLQSFSSGFCGAVFATCFNAPFDVVKSRFQCQVAVSAVSSVSSSGGAGTIAVNAPVQLKYRGVIQSLLLIYREEGFAAVYKGFIPKAIRMGLGGATAICVYELVLSVFAPQ